MANKQDLLEFINDNIEDGVTMLRTVERIIICDPNNDMLNNDDIGYKGYATPKANLLDIISNNFDDALQGNLPNDPNVIKILDWWTIPYPE